MASFSVLEFFLFLFKGRKKEKEKRRLFGTFFFFLEHFKSIKVHLLSRSVDRIAPQNPNFSTILSQWSAKCNNQFLALKFCDPALIDYWWSLVNGPLCSCSLFGIPPGDGTPLWLSPFNGPFPRANIVRALLCFGKASFCLYIIQFLHHTLMVVLVLAPK